MFVCACDTLCVFVCRFGTVFVVVFGLVCLCVCLCVCTCLCLCVCTCFRVFAWVGFSDLVLLQAAPSLCVRWPWRTIFFPQTLDWTAKCSLTTLNTTGPYERPVGRTPLPNVSKLPTEALSGHSKHQSAVSNTSSRNAHFPMSP